MNAHPKHFAKALIGQTVVRSGLWRRRLRMWAAREAVIIVTYHRVIEKWDDTLGYSQPGMVVTTSTFERQLAILKEDFEIVPLGALLGNGNAARRGTRPRCIVTFDDGWRDNYDLALPILRRYDVPATIYLATDFIGTNRTPWHTKVMRLLIQTKLPSRLGDERAFRAYPAPVRHHLNRLAKLDGTARAHDLDPLIEAAKALLDADAMEALLHSLTTAVGVRPLVLDRPLFLDWDQVRTMAATGVEIGSHTCSHRMMTKLSAEQAGDELIRSKAEIERRIGRQVMHFAFPYEDANGPLLAAAASAGYRTACVGGSVAGQGPFGIRPLRRLGMHEGVGGAGQSFDEALLRRWLFRAPTESA